MKRYKQQIALKKIGKTGQSKISQSKISIVGVGALGTVAAELLVRSGVGSLTLIDRDFIEISNLQRQSLFTENDIGKSKAHCAKHQLEKINANCIIDAKSEDLNSHTLHLIKKHSILLSCVDNTYTRFLINAYAKKNNIDYIHGGAEGWIGQVFTIKQNGACYNCLFPHQSTHTCDATGVMNAVTHTVGSIMANEALKHILNVPTDTFLTHLNLETNTFRKIHTKQNPSCPLCKKTNKNYLSTLLDQESKNELRELCGTGMYQIYMKHLNFSLLKKQINHAPSTQLSTVIHVNDLSIFSSGRILIKAKTKKDAKKKLSLLKIC